ncbi:putative THO complex, subunit THOC1 protein [Lupinus albus]|uniref:Putative THO complex, subunit THOC1 protein n=1 Tax=Lupinus albus TaxID=3870 RepID=A0A6A4NVT6_LUPAL|nr:putative THO complex, subunit THOC1 protein [Lupinus albus]
MEVLKRAIMQQSGPPETFALKMVQEVINPPPKQTKLAQDENQFLENVLRLLLQEFVSASGEKIMQFGQSIDDSETETTQGHIPRLLDITLYLCEKEHIEGGMIFQLLEDLTEMSTMENCKDVFGYIESKQDILGKRELFARGKLVMLRTCNQLLRRLSKANDVVFCGRILMFLARFFPLSERSALNIKGVFNTTNETKYEKEPLEGICIDFNFYQTFWGLQEYFSSPTSVNHAPAKWKKFASSLSVVLNTFEAQPLSDEEGDANNLEEEAVNFSIKYLTSSKLMGLELKDPSFRRHVLVQCLILFDYLKAPGKNDTDLPSETLKEEITLCEERVKKLLQLTPPKGREFLCKIEHILEREKNWVWWKRDGCLPYERQPMEKKTVQGDKKRRPRWRLGNKELSQLWKWADQNPNALTDPHRVQTPSIMEYWKPLAEDMDPSAGIEGEYHHKNKRVYCWKGLRLAARQDLEGFSKFTDLGIEGVVPLELLPPDVRSKYQAKPNDRGKRSKKEETKATVQQVEENQIATPANEIDGEDVKTDTTATPMEFDATTVIGTQGGPTPDEHQKQSSDNDVGQEAGQLEADAEVEAGIIDGETDADVD